MNPDPLTGDVAARVLLARVAGPASRLLGTALSTRSAPEVVAEVRAGRLPGAPAHWAEQVNAADPARLVAADLAAMVAVGARPVVPSSAEWPTQLDDLGVETPILLWILGSEELRFAALRSVAIVGARASTPYGDLVAAELAAGLVERGWTVISGGAYGIDAAAHRGALTAGGPTIAVMAGGLDMLYPRGHDALFAAVAESGVIVAEAAPGLAPHRAGFLVRNRLIAALSRGTVVVEAAVRSGALATARDARTQLRVVMGVPGPVTSAMSSGVHALLRDDAILVTDVDDVIEAVGPLGLDAVAPQPTDPFADQVLGALPDRAAVSVERLCTTIGSDPSRVVAVLGLLELAGRVERTLDGWRRPRRSRP